MADLPVNRPRADFLLALDEATRPFVEAAEITRTIATLLGQYLHVERCVYMEVTPDRNAFEQCSPTCLSVLQAGQPYDVGDSEIWIPLLKGGDLVAVLTVQDAKPRTWRADEIELVQTVANRCWESIERGRLTQAIDQLTGGVAHAFNNLLTVILGNLDTIARQLPVDNPKLMRAIDHAMRGTRRAAALTHQLLAFSRRQALNSKPADVNQLVIGLMELIRRTLPEAIVVKSRLTSGLQRANVDSNQLESALFNLAVNARDAMAEGGSLLIETEAARVDEALAQKMAGNIVPGNYIVIVVRDTGVGMTSEVRARAFDPFFTTKPQGQGTGLGLSQVFGFVKQSGGHVQLESTPGRGTTVKIYLPCTAGEGVQPAKAGEAEMPHGESNETVLVVEDEDDVRIYSTDSLRDLGFSVLAASDGPAALRIIKEHPEIRLLFTDVGLPRMSGRELAEEAWKIRPQLPVLFVTGYAHDNLFQHGRLDPAADLLTKPFDRAQLALRVRRMLDTPVRH